MALITEQDDQSLVERFRAGDTDAFQTIVERHYPRLLANAVRRTGDRAQAEDCVQEALIRAYTRLHRFGDNGEFHLDAWLHTIVTNCCRDLGRRSGRDERLVARVSGQIDVAAPAAEELVAEADPKVAEALAALPDGYRNAIELRFLDELDYDELAAAEGISEQNARARVSRGRSMMRRLLDGAAAVIWLLPGLRRSDVSGQAEAANQAQSAAAGAMPAVSGAAPAVANAAPALSQAAQSGSVTNGLAQVGSGLANVVPNLASTAAQVAPTVASAAPAVQSSAPAIGKAVVAVGLAATVAVPASGVIDAKPEPITEAAVVVDESPTEAIDAPVEVEATTSAPAIVIDEIVVTGDRNRDAAAPPSTDAVEPADDTSATATTVAPAAPAPAADASGEEPASDDPGTEDTVVAGDAQEAPAPAPAPSPVVAAGDALALEWAGPRAVLDGPVRIGDDATGDLSARIRLGDEDGPVEVEGDATITLADGRIVELRLRGTATTDDARREFALDVDARIRGGEAIGVADRGAVTGVLVVTDDTASLHLDLPPAAPIEPATEPAAGDDGTEPAPQSGATEGQPAEASADEQPAGATDSESTTASEESSADDA